MVPSKSVKTYSKAEQQQQHPKKHKAIRRNQTEMYRIGKEMYTKEMDRAKKREKMNQRIKEEEMERIMKEHSFTPIINKKSKQLVSSKSQSNVTKIEDRLILQGKLSKTKKFKKKIEQTLQEDIETSNLTFIPTITPQKKLPKYIQTAENYHTKKDNKEEDDMHCSFSARKPNKGKSKEKIYDYLYNTAKVIEEKKKIKSEEQLKKTCTFHPEISKRSNELSKNENFHQFINRLHQRNDKNEEIVIGNETFRPKITRGPKNPNQRTVNVNLDTFHDKNLLNEKTLIHTKEMFNALEKKQQWLFRTMNIVVKMKILKFKEIFDLLDGDHDGFISSEYIKLSDLDHEILISLSPILEQLSSTGVVMDFKEFVSLAEKHLTDLIFSKTEKEKNNYL